MELRLTDARSPISCLVVRPAVRVAADATLREAARLMRDENVSSLVVLSPGLAVVTERDLTRALAADLDPQTTVQEVATPRPVVAGPDLPILEAAAVMLNEDVRHLLVALADGDVGVVSLRAVVAVLLQVHDPNVWLTNLRVMVNPPSDLWWG